VLIAWRALLWIRADAVILLNGSREGEDLLMLPPQRQSFIIGHRLWLAVAVRVLHGYFTRSV
jgi:hypothetical protein